MGTTRSKFATLSTYVLPEDAPRLKQMACARGITVAQLLRDCIDGYLEDSGDEPLAMPGPRGRPSRESATV